MFFSKQKNKISVNGVVYEVEGNNISMTNGKIYVDGKLVETGTLSGDVKLTFEGDLVNLKSDTSVKVNGNVNGHVDAGGSVSVGGSIFSYVDAGGSVNCTGDIDGNIDAGGSVTCGNVKGDVDAGGSIRMNK